MPHKNKFEIISCSRNQTGCLFVGSYFSFSFQLYLYKLCKMNVLRMNYLFVLCALSAHTFIQLLQNGTSFAQPGIYLINVRITSFLWVFIYYVYDLIDHVRPSEYRLHLSSSLMCEVLFRFLLWRFQLKRQPPKSLLLQYETTLHKTSFAIE